MGHKDRKVYRKRKTPAAPFFIFCHLGSKNCQTKCSDTKTVVCSLIYIPTYINRHDKKKNLVDIVWVGGLLDNDRDPSIAHPPTEDHPLADSLVLSLAVQELLITITTQSAANEPGGGSRAEKGITGHRLERTVPYCGPL